MQLKIEHLSFTYDGAPEAVFADLSLSLDTAWRTGLIARNGRGKTTLLRLLSGDLQGKGKIDCPLMPVLFPYPVADGTQTAWQIAQTAASTCEDWRLMRELSLLNVPEEALNRPFDTLSGGEQQMLAMGRALMSNASMLMLDEPSMGLSPLLVQEIFDIIQNVHKEGMTILLVEQNAQMALSVADRAYVLETGRVVMDGTGAELLTNERVRSAYLGG